MPLVLPDLDSLQWEDLVEEARATIASSRLSWTDFNAHDPGVTVTELLAWLVEQRGYRLNRIPEKHRRKFLALLGVVPEPAKAARAVIGVSLAGPSTPVSVSRRSLAIAQTDGGDVTFRTLSGVTATGTQITALVTESSAGVASDLTSSWRAGRVVAPWGDDPSLGAAFLVGLDPPPPPGSVFSLWLELGDGAEAGRAVRRELAEEARARRCACRRPDVPWHCGAPSPHEQDDSRPKDEDPSLSLHHSVRVEWAIHTAGGWRVLGEDQVTDGTRGLSLAGMVRIEMPEATTAIRVAGRDCTLRARLVRGRPDVAPRLAGVIPNAVEALQVTAEHSSLELGRGLGLPGEEFPLPGVTVLDGRVEVTVQGARTTDWRVVRDLDASGRSDELAIDLGRGVLTSGDGRHGRVIPRGGRVLASYRTTEGSLGNVARDLPWRIEHALHTPSGLLVGSPLGASGGADAEPLSSAAERAAAQMWAHERLVELTEEADATTLDQIQPDRVRHLRAPARAVTLLDYERLALAVPGTEVRRARAWSAVDPALPCAEAEGTVTVVVVPGLPARRPAPSVCLLQVVRAFLAPRRLVGTRLQVVGPTYVDIHVEVRVAARPRRDPERVNRAVEDRLHSYLHALSGGPGGFGWPFGRDVRASELMQLIDGVEDVDHVVSIVVSGAGGTACGDVCIPPAALPALAPPRVEVVS